MKPKFSLCLLVMFAILFACTASSSTKSEVSDDDSNLPPDGKLFLKTTMWSGSLSIEWIFLGDDGTIIFNPKHGVNPVNVIAERNDNISSIGTYKVVGNALQIKWANGKSDTWNFEKNNGKYSFINGGIVTTPQALPTNYKITGTYSGGAVTANLSASSTLNFKADGTFTEGRYGAVSTQDVGASSADKKGGSYSIKGNTLQLKYTTGEKYVAVVGIYKISDAITYFIINDTSYRQQ